MNPLWGTIAGISIIAMMIVFIGTWIWLWHAQHKPKFDALARLPMDEEKDQP